MNRYLVDHPDAAYIVLAIAAIVFIGLCWLGSRKDGGWGNGSGLT